METSLRSSAPKSRWNTDLRELALSRSGGRRLLLIGSMCPARIPCEATAKAGQPGPAAATPLVSDRHHDWSCSSDRPPGAPPFTRLLVGLRGLSDPLREREEVYRSVSGRHRVRVSVHRALCNPRVRRFAAPMTWEVAANTEILTKGRSARDRPFFMHSRRLAWCDSDDPRGRL